MQAASPWLYIYPQGMQEFLVYFKEKYESPIIYLTENGKNKMFSYRLSSFCFQIFLFRIEKKELMCF